MDSGTHSFWLSLIAHCVQESGSKLTPLQRALNKLGGIIGVMSICVLGA